MTKRKVHHQNRSGLFLLCLLLLAACKNGTVTTTPNQPNPEASGTPASAAMVTATFTPFSPPTSNPSIPLAASVNGQGIPLTEYQTNIELALTASETGLATYSEDEVLQNMIDEVLLAQGAQEAGFSPDDAFIQSRIDQLEMNEAKLQDWMIENGYSQDSFKQAFARSILAAWMRDQIIAQVPSTAEQVHARQILLYNSDEAETIYAQLQAGTDFATLATKHDPLSSGELGWFPQGYLTVPELDTPVFSLQPGEYTEVIKTVLGFHIIQVIEKDSQHPLSPGAYQNLQVQAVEDWLIERRSQSNIQILLP